MNLPTRMMIMIVLLLLCGVVFMPHKSDTNQTAPTWNLDQVDTAIAGDIIMQLDGSMRLVLGGERANHTLILLAPDLIRTTQQVAMVKANTKRFTLGTHVEREGQYEIFVEQLVQHEIPHITHDVH